VVIIFVFLDFGKNFSFSDSLLGRKDIRFEKLRQKTKRPNHLFREINKTQKTYQFGLPPPMASNR